MICGNKRKVESGLKLKETTWYEEHKCSHVNTLTRMPAPYPPLIRHPFQFLQHPNTRNKHILHDDILLCGSKLWHAISHRIHATQADRDVGLLEYIVTIDAMLQVRDRDDLCLLMWAEHLVRNAHDYCKHELGVAA